MIKIIVYLQHLLIKYSDIKVFELEKDLLNVGEVKRKKINNISF